MERIVAGFDDSAGSSCATRWAARLARMCDAELVVATAIAPAEDEDPPPELIEQALARLRAELDRWNDDDRLRGFGARTAIEVADARVGLLAVMHREGADLLVVGRVGHSSGPGLLHTGSMAEWLAHNADVPVAVIGHGSDGELRTVLVAVDGSSGSRAAVRWVRELARGTGIEVVAASVAQPGLEWTAASSPRNWRRALEHDIVTDLAAEVAVTAATVTPAALEGGNVAAALLDAAQDHGADLVVMGARGLGGFTGLRVGGVAMKVLHRADRPIVLVPPDA